MSRATIQTIDPTTFEPLQEYPTFSDQEMDRILDLAVVAQREWSATAIGERVNRLRAIAAAIRDRQEMLAERIVTEMGKPVREALGELEKCAWVFDYYADAGPSFLRDVEIETGAKRSWVAYEPLGVLLAIMPWNFPWWQVARFAAPALLAGNAVLLKHSPNVTGCALDIEALFSGGGLPADLFRTLLVAEPDVPATVSSLIADARIAAVSLTGSERAGSAVGALAGREIKPSLLELGGSDPFIVLDDADLDRAVRAAVTSRFLNCGQSCVSAKRFLVHESCHDEFVSRFTTEIARLNVGDPASENTDIGPLARADLVDALDAQVQASVAAGARIATGGRRLERPGAWYLPTLLTDVDPGMSVMVEETFGPVAVVARFGDDKEAITLANATRFGLAMSIWSSDEHRAIALARGITTGAAFINAVVASDPRLPFGGTKRSGYGRELGASGALAFANARSYFVGAAA